MATTYSGKCPCGAIHYECFAQPAAMYNCHCRGCQKLFGTASVPLLVMHAGTISVAGEQTTVRIPGDRHPKRLSCAHCGYALFAHSDVTPDILLVNALTLEGNEAFTPVADIWTADANEGTLMDRQIPKVLKSPPLLGTDFV